MRKAGVLLAVLLIGAVAHAGPGTMSFQGSLTDGSGTPIPDDTYDMRFTVYSEEVGGASAWTETLNGVEVQNGLYSVVLGETTTLHPSIFANDYSLWLEIEVDVAGDGFDAGDVYSPRQPITAAGWAMDAERLNGRAVGDLQLRVTGSAPAGEYITAIQADGSVVTSPLPPGGGTLDEAYDFGGAGAGRTITADSGPVLIEGLGGLQSEGDLETDNDVNVFDVLGGPVRARLGSVGSRGGRVETWDEDTTRTILAGSSASAGGFIYVYNGDNVYSVDIDGDYLGNPRMIMRYNDAGIMRTTVNLQAYDATGGTLEMSNANGTELVDLRAATNGGSLELLNANGTETIEIVASESGTSDGGQIRMRKGDGTVGIEIDGDFNGDGRVTTDELQITGGSDLSEQFDIQSADGKVEPGMVVSIDPARPGQLRVSSEAYDRTVAGIVSGAGGIKPGMLMGQVGTTANGDHPVALSGRVYCWCDASTGAIEPGNLLTTSNVPGHAMKVTDSNRAHGAILGKAMTALPEGRGLVLVLVALH